MKHLPLVLAIIFVFFSCKTTSKKSRTADPGLGPTVAEVPSAVETEPVKSTEDAADDPCIRVHPETPRIVGTDKNEKTGGLYVYNLEGEIVQFLSDPSLNNVDIRYNFVLGDDTVDIAAASRRNDSTLGVYAINDTGHFRRVEDGSIKTVAPYGCCLYHDRSTNKYYYFVVAKSGEIEQWMLFSGNDGFVSANPVRRLRIPSQGEGCVADDRTGLLYVGEENGGIWRFDARPEGDTTGTLLAEVDSTRLVGDVEGLALYPIGTREGYLIASSQGSNTFAVYGLTEDFDYLLSFALSASNGIDSVTHTDGIDVTACRLGEQFPNGLFVAQDDENTGENQNFKMVGWDEIVKHSGGRLTAQDATCLR